MTWFILVESLASSKMLNPRNRPRYFLDRLRLQLVAVSSGRDTNLIVPEIHVHIPDLDVTWE